MRAKTDLHAVALLLACTAACTSAPEPVAAAQPLAAEPQPDTAPVESARPWTETFMEPAVLVAREIRIEGPAGIRGHVALTIDSEVHDYEVSTSPEGLLQVLAVKPGAAGALVRCQLDRLQIAAEVSVRVLERPGDVPVVVTAVGDAVWQTPGGGEQRADTLRLVGQQESP